MSNPEFTAPNFSTQTASAYKANLDAAIAANNPVTNLGFSLSAGTFTVHGHEGTALASTNPAFVRFQDPDNFGYNKFISIEANQDFIDDAGSSEIIGNLFGESTGVATTVDIIFTLYAVSNDDMDSVALMISRDPYAKLSPAAANIGAPDDAVADAIGDFFSLENLDETLYDENPCVALGTFTMTMSASDDWTVQALTAKDGIGSLQKDRLQSAFLAISETQQNNVTGDGTAQKVQFDTVIKDHNNDYDETTNYQFVAPVTGLYHFDAAALIRGIDGSDTSMNIKLVTSNRTHTSNSDAYRDAGGDASVKVSVLTDMDAGDTAYITVTVSGSGTVTADIFGSSGSLNTFFSGYLVV